MALYASLLQWAQQEGDHIAQGRKSHDPLQHVEEPRVEDNTTLYIKSWHATITMQTEDSTPTLRPHLAVVDEFAWPQSVQRRKTSSSLSEELLLNINKPRPARLSMDFRPIEPVSRKQEMQHTFRLVSTIGFTSLVTGT